MQEQFAFPPIHSFPPFFTKQIHEETLSKQLALWSEIILGYAAMMKSFFMHPELPILSNAAIKRSVQADLYEALVEYMLSRKRLTRLDESPKKKIGASDGRLLIWFKTPTEWVASILEYVQSTGNMGGTILTVYELFHGEDTDGLSFHSLPDAHINVILGELEGSGRAALLGNRDVLGEMGIKFV